MPEKSFAAKVRRHRSARHPSICIGDRCARQPRHLETATGRPGMVWSFLPRRIRPLDPSGFHPWTCSARCRHQFDFLTRLHCPSAHANPLLHSSPSLVRSRYGCRGRNQHSCRRCKTPSTHCARDVGSDARSSISPESTRNPYAIKLVPGFSWRIIKKDRP